METKGKILAVDDDLNFLGDLESTLTNSFDVKKAENVSQAMHSLSVKTPDLILLDMNMPEISGLDFLKVLKQKNISVPIIVLTGESSPEVIVAAMKAGATDYIIKGSPDFMTSLSVRVSQALTLHDIKKQNEILSSKVKESAAKYDIMGISNETIKLRAEIAKYKNTRAFVLIQGENGTGKELIARTLNIQEGDPARPFIAVNCGAVSPNLFESELFGHIRGAFTGATTDQIGKFVAANGGDIFLDEIGELPPEMQVKLLRVLQEKVVTPVGSTKTISLNIRVIAATNKKIEELVAQGKFREDLYFRLNHIVLKTIPLRERPDDILFLAQFIARRSIPGITISREAKRILENHSWPGNVRELQNTIERACILIRGSSTLQIQPQHLSLTELHASNKVTSLPADLLPVTVKDVNPQQYRLSLDWMEKNFFSRSQNLLGGDNTAVIDKLKISRSYYYKRKKELGSFDEEAGPQ